VLQSGRSTARDNVCRWETFKYDSDVKTNLLREIAANCHRNSLLPSIGNFHEANFTEAVEEALEVGILFGTFKELLRRLLDGDAVRATSVLRLVLD
tara:strand:- start:617 stop:904 length:288 start_codon:yes stop_codon:yes gene_type:complete